MSLTWNVSGIENADEVCWITLTADRPENGLKAGEKILNPVTEALIFASMVTGIGRITAENAAEVFARISLIERGTPFLRRGVDHVGPTTISATEVLAHVGLVTNAAFKDEPRSKWGKRFIDMELDSNAVAVKRLQREVANA